MTHFGRIVLALALLALLALGCEKLPTRDHGPLQIGEGEAVQQATLTPRSKRTILLRGGNGKFIAHVADSRVAQVKVSRDTLTISGLRMGDTYAVVRSMDQEAKLDIHVQPSELVFSRTEISVPRGKWNSTVTLSGGGVVSLSEHDPDNLVNVQWLSNGVIRIQAHKQPGQAVLTASSEGLKDKHLIIKVE